MEKLTKAVFLCSILALTAVSLAVPLTDGELYFDPATITPDYYTRIYLDDLGSANTYIWDAGGDDVLDADILPVLKPGEYPLNYVYSQADFLQLPNVDYSADLETGTLQATFLTPGLYHMRVTRGSGAIIYAVFAESWMKEKAGETDKTDKTKKVDPVPNGDLFLVENSDDTLDNSATIWGNNGRTVERVDNRQQVIDKIIAKSKALGRKIHAEIDGHGASGIIGTGSGTPDVPDKQIDMKSVAAFQKSVDKYVNNITFQGCSVGKGKQGQRFLQILADSIGKAGAWNEPVAVVGTSHFAVPVGAKFVQVVVTNTKDIQYHVPVVVNCVGTTDPNKVNAIIKQANKKLKDANIKLEVKQVNKNVNVGNGDNKINEDEMWDLRSKGKKELAKVIKDKKGKWTGKGMKIYIADDCWEEKPSKTNWAWKHNQCMGIESGIDPNLMSQVIRKYFNPEKIYDPNYTDGEKAEERKEAKAAGKKVCAEKKQVSANGTKSAGGSEKEVGARAAILDDVYDITGPIDPCDAMYAYVDIHSVALESTSMSNADGQTLIRLALNGVFPGSEPNPYMPPNPERIFTADYQINIHYPTEGTGQIIMRVWKDSPEKEIRTYAWYDGPLSNGEVGELLILDGELCSEPNDGEEFTTNHVLELTVANDKFFEPGSEPFEGQVALSVEAVSDDEGLIITDIAEELADPNFDLTFTLLHETLTMSVIGPASDPNGRGLGVTGSGFGPFIDVAVSLNGDAIGTAVTDEFGDFLYYADSGLALEESQLYTIEISDVNDSGDVIDVESVSTDFEYSHDGFADIEGEIDGDGDVDLVDFALLAYNWLYGT